MACLPWASFFSHPPELPAFEHQIPLLSHDLNPLYDFDARDLCDIIDLPGRRLSCRAST